MANHQIVNCSECEKQTEQGKHSITGYANPDDTVLQDYDFCSLECFYGWMADRVFGCYW